MAAYALAGLPAESPPMAAQEGAARFGNQLRSRSAVAIAVGLLVWAYVPAAATEPQTATPVFEREVLPILSAHCLKCHGLEACKASLDLRTAGLIMRGGDSGPAIAAGSPGDSPLYARIADRSMPPKGELPLDDEKIEIVRRWIASGANAAGGEPALGASEAPAVSEEDRSYWAFQKARRPAAPPVRDGARVRSPVDAFVLARLERQGLGYSQPAAPRTLVRRLHFDLTGLPPSPEEIEQFLAECAAAGEEAAYDRLVERLLASPHYGERWGRHWLDAAGYVDVNGSDNDAAIIKIAENKWLYRDYVVKAINDDKPFDRFLTEQLAGDELVDWRKAEKFTPEIRESLVATGYLRAGIDDTDQKELNTALIRYRVLHLTIDVVGSGLLGLTTGCARCHSHKFDPIPQRDYYRLMAVLSPAFNPQSWLPLDQRFLPDVSPAEQRAINEHNAALDRRIEPLQAQMAAIEAAQRQRLVDAKLAALPEPIRADVKAAIERPAERRNEVQKYLAGKFESSLKVSPEEVAAALGADDKATIAGLQTQIAASNAQKRSWGKLQATWDVGPPPETFLLRRGDHETPGAEVEPGFPSVLCDDDGAMRTADAVGETSGRRLALVRWLTDPDSRAGALAARVQVNRAWQRLFGEGLVATTENLGRSGAPPTHPELLEWLAAEFIDEGWRIKPLLRTLVRSSAYRQGSYRTSGASDAKSDPEAVDPDNRLLWRMRLRQLEAEAVRDAILAASGALDRTLGGPPVELENRPDGMVVIDEKKLRTPSSKWRRSLYVLARRNYHLSLLQDFDQPAVATNCTRRTPSAVVTQSLTLLNDAFLFEQAERFARRVVAVSPAAASAAQVDAAFQIALGRPAKPIEVDWAVELLARQAERFRAQQLPAEDANHKAMAQLCHTLLATNEFLYVP